MTKQPYLPAVATAQEAVDWLQAETDEPWPLVRLLESGVMAHVWLAPTPDQLATPEVFNVVFEGRHEGYLAPVLFGGDTHRLSSDRTGTLSMTRSPSGTVTRPPTPISFSLDQLRFKAEQLRGLVAPAPAEPATAAVKGPDGAKRWTPERLEELSKYRDAHGTKAAGEKFGISVQRVRQLLPGEKPRPQGYSAFSLGVK